MTIDEVVKLLDSKTESQLKLAAPKVSAALVEQTVKDKWPRKAQRLVAACANGDKDLKKLLMYLKEGQKWGWQAGFKLDNWAFGKSETQ